MKMLLGFLLTFNAFALEMSQADRYLGYRHLHYPGSHKAMKYMQKNKLIEPFINKGRVNVYRVIKPLSYKNLPDYVKRQFFPVVKSDLLKEADLSNQGKTINKRTVDKLKLLKKSQYQTYVESLVALGSRSRQGVAVDYVSTELSKIGLEPIRTDYNVVSLLEGETQDSMVIIGHMDTVNGTVGADDNASGAAGVLELARVLTKSFEGKKPKYSLYFVVSENEEEGLLGAKKFVQRMKDAGNIENIKLSINMDMIAYNKNGIVDLETSKKYEDLANFFASQASKYTSLKSNLVLNPWGSDHVPFLNAGVPALLTIETWQTHTPCWHKSCDTLSTLNYDYALEILKLNASVVIDMNQ